MTFSDSEEQIFNKILETVEGEMEVEYLQEPSQAILTFPGLEIRIREQEVYHNNTFVPLSHYEFSTLLYLAKHPNWVFSKEQIYTAVWKASGDSCGTAVTNVISHIRRKIGTGYIETVIGCGYKFVG